MAFIIVSCVIAVLFFAVPKQSAAPATQQPVPVPQKPAPVPQRPAPSRRKPANRPVSRPAPRKKNTSSGSSQPVIIINSTPAVQPAAPVQTVSVPAAPAVTKVPQAPKAGGTAVPVSSAGQKSGSPVRPAVVTQPQAAPQKTTVQPAPSAPAQTQAAPQKTTVLSVPSAPANTQPAEHKTIEDRQINSSSITIDLSPQNTVPPVRESTPPRRSKRKIQIMN